MSTLTPLHKDEAKFLSSFLPPESPANNDRPHVTLTYATSLDGLISISPGFRTIISGPETKSMTHYLRANHDAILVGSNTAIYDNPSLNCRYDDVALASQPRPVIIDSTLQWNPSGKQVVQLHKQQSGKKPWIFYRAGTTIPPGYPCADVELIELASSAHHLEWTRILSILKTRAIDSLMVEGGASIIRNLLRRPELVDATVVTIGPTWLGSDGSSAHVAPVRTKDDGEANAARLKDVAWRQFGQDMVLCGRLSTTG